MDIIYVTFGNIWATFFIQHLVTLVNGHLGLYLQATYLPR